MYDAAMRRVMRHILVLLLLGAVVNIAVTWGCWKWARTWHIDWAPSGLTSATAPSVYLRQWRAPGVMSAVGLVIQSQAQLDAIEPALTYSDLNGVPLRAIVLSPWYSRSLLEQLMSTSDPGLEDGLPRVQRAISWGWPLHCFSVVREESMDANTARYIRRRLAASTMPNPADLLLLEFDWHMRPVDSAGPWDRHVVSIVPAVFNVVMYAALLALCWGWLRLVRIFVINHQRAVKVITLTGFAAVGTTVLVAWVCALFLDPMQPSNSLLLQRAGGRQFENGNVHDGALIFEHRATGGRIIRSRWYTLGYAPNIGGSWPEDPLEAVLPWWWGEMLQPRPLPHLGTHHVRIGEAWGLPFLAMWSGRVFDDRGTTPNPTPSLFEVQRGFRVPKTTVQLPSGPAERLLPLGIIWPGFILNTVFYWWLWLTLFMLAWGGLNIRPALRRRRGLCASCGYDLRASDAARCPECGKSEARS